MTHSGDGNICWQPLSDVYDAVEYSGTQSRSNGGYECANWNDESVHEHKFKAGDHNYCRNPDGGADGPWCYTTDPETKWDLCPVDQCQTSANEFTNAQLNCGQRPLFRNDFSSYFNLFDLEVRSHDRYESYDLEYGPENLLKLFNRKNHRWSRRKTW